jgi:hypothetical protein
MTNKPMPPEMVKAFAELTIQNSLLIGRCANAHHHLFESLGVALPGSVSTKLLSDIEQVQGAVAQLEAVVKRVQAMLEKL